MFRYSSPMTVGEIGARPWIQIAYDSRDMVCGVQFSPNRRVSGAVEFLCDTEDSFVRIRERRAVEMAAFEQVATAAEAAHGLDLEVNAGHGLGYETIKYFKGLSMIDEFSIGHSIISRSVFVGIDRAVKEMVALIKAL